MIELESERLRIRELRADDLPRLLPIHASNPDFLALTEGSDGQVGIYDLARFQRDWQIGQLMDGRHMLGAFARTGDEAIGFADFLEEHEDGLPWLGAILIARTRQRQGFGTELERRLERHFREDYGWSTVRAAVLAANAPGLAFVRFLGFQPIAETQQRGPDGPRACIVFERSLEQPA